MVQSELEQEIKLNVIRGKIKEHNMTNNGFAQKIGMGVTSFSLKLNGKREFTASEISRIANELKVPVQIFFKNNV